MVPPLTSNKAAWQWAETTKPGDVTLNHVLTAYKMNLNFCNSCRKNVKGNPCCLSGLGEKIWLNDASPADDSDLLREENSVGLKNLGATCYANAFLQVWFHMPEIRNAVFSWNSRGVEDASSICQIISCLQEVFGLLYFSKRRFIDPTILLNCLLLDNTVQQDAQEFSKLFMSKLDELASRGRSIFHDFVGRYDYVTSCSKCGNKTRRSSEFYELDLNVINNKRLSSCLEEFLKQETLDGDNQFFCSTCQMKQNAKRCIELVQLPDTLNLQLLRFVYDKEKQSKKKISSPLTFPETLDMSPYVKEIPSKEGGSPDESLTYDLFAILIHSGQLASSGHYIAVIRDYKTGSIFQFNDEKVVKLDSDLSGYDLDNAVGEGCSTSDKDNSNNNKVRKPKINREMSLCNAYMLVYRRRNAAVNITEDIAFKDLPKNLRQKILNHNAELEEDISNESKKLELINEKQENIKLLYSTIMSYEGCSAEVKSDMFEFVPAQNLRKFFHFGDKRNDGNKTKAAEMDNNEMETSMENDDNDNDISAVNYNYDKEYGKFFCKHKRLNPDEVMQLKILPSCIVDIMYSQLGLTRRLPCSEVLCRECVVKRCSDINAKLALNEDCKRIANIMKSKQYEPFGYIVGKESWRNWKKKAERNLLLDFEEGMETDQPMMDVKDDPIALEMFNSDLLCCHDQLDPNEQNWKNVSYEVWEIVRKYFPSSPEYTYGSPCCAICEDKSQQEQMVQDESKQQAILLRQLLNDLYLSRKRPSLTTLRDYQMHLNNNNNRRSNINNSKSAEMSKSETMSSAIVISDDEQKPDQSDFGLYGGDYEGCERVPKDRLKYFLVSSVFIDAWKKCCKDATKQKMPRSVCNNHLVCYHGKLLFDPWDSMQSVEISRQFVLLWPEEWDILKSYIDVVDQEIYVEIAESKSTGTSFAISIPEVCVECMEERRIEELNSRYHYNKARIYVYRLDDYDSDSLANPTNQNSAASQNNKADDKSKKRKSDEEAVQPAEKYPRLESSATIRRSGRRSKNRGEKEIMVRSDMTLRELNFELFTHFQVFKTNQVLYMEGRELVGDDLTLEMLRVPPEAIIRLEVREDLDEHFVTNTVGGTVEEGFKGTGLVG